MTDNINQSVEASLERAVRALETIALAQCISASREQSPFFEYEEAFSVVRKLATELRKNLSTSGGNRQS